MMIEVPNGILTVGTTIRGDHWEYHCNDGTSVYLDPQGPYWADRKDLLIELLFHALAHYRDEIYGKDFFRPNNE